MPKGYAARVRRPAGRVIRLRGCCDIHLRGRHRGLEQGGNPPCPTPGSRSRCSAAAARRAARQAVEQVLAIVNKTKVIRS